VPAIPSVAAPPVEHLRLVPDEELDESVSRRLISRRDMMYRRVLAGADVLAVVIAMLISMAVVGRNHPEAITLLCAPLVIVLGKLLDIYDREEWLVRKSTLDEAPALFQVATLFAIVVWLINGLLVNNSNGRHELLAIWPSALGALLVMRTVGRYACRHLTAPERCLVIGDEHTCDRMRTKLSRTSSLHAIVAAHIPIDSWTSAEEAIVAITDQRDLRALALSHDIDRIIVAPERADSEEVLNLIRASTALGIKVSVVPKVLEVVGSSAEFDDVEGVPLLSMRRVYLSRSSQRLKRLLDFVGSGAILLVISPLLAIIAALIKLDSEGSVLYRQPRIGRDGASFEMLKFRTMVPGAHALRDDLLHLNEADGGLFKITNDPRITRVGRLLRRLSLDEMPQLFNVLRGDMSLVGPRPLIPEEDRRIQGWHRRRLALTPGMTGHWQILGSSRIPLDEMVKIDYLYVTNWSLWLDIKILLRTIAYVAARKGM
jgi:exopolysaccharide biosynthesis polyprenyl glycosylphosphotransferase